VVVDIDADMDGGVCDGGWSDVWGGTVEEVEDDDDDEESCLWYPAKAKLGLFTLLCMKDDAIIVMVSADCSCDLRFWFFSISHQVSISRVFSRFDIFQI
jgi:hypothetical protein